jgi:CubicO group peptidase (beta-lactamase class C family)
MKYKCIRTIIASFILLGLVVFSIPARAQRAKLDSFLKQKLEEYHLAGLSVVAIDSGKIVWTGYYGYQDLEKRIPVTEQTLFEAASTSKTVTAAAVMQLYAAGKFKLDDDINKYLDFKIVNPHHPNIPITFRQLLRHRAAIDDNVDYLGQFWSSNHGDPKIALGEFVRDYFSPKGKHYDKAKNFYAYAAGTKANYSNMGIALLGYLVERITGMPFDKYCKEKLFRPLGMDRSGWFLRDVDSTNVAMPYVYSDSLQRFERQGFGGFPDYPAGSLHTNVEQFAHFLIAWTQQGKWKGNTVFDAGAIQTLTPDDINLGFHTWFLYGTNKGELIYMHRWGGWRFVVHQLQSG